VEAKVEARRVSRFGSVSVPRRPPWRRQTMVVAGSVTVPSYCQVTYSSVATANASSTCNTIITVTAESGSAGVALR